MTYDDLLERQREAESRLREEKLKEGHLLEDMIHLKRQAAARMNSRNERKSRYEKISEDLCSFECKVFLFCSL